MADFEKNPPPSEEDREEPSPAPCYDLVEGEDPDDFVSVEVPSLNDEDQGRTVMPLAGRRGGLLRRARKTKRETSIRGSEEEYTSAASGDISQLTTDEDHLFSTDPPSVTQSMLREDMLISLSQAAIEASSITGQIATPSAELVTPADEESTKEATKARLGSMSTDEREFEDEDVTSTSWAMHHKHVFILSISGKPIYSRYGKEEKLVSLFGVMQALVSIVQDDNDTLRCIETGSHRMVFVSRQPLVLVAASRSRQQSEQQLTLQLLYCYYQIISVLTNTQLQQIFQRSAGFDLRHLLQGSEKFIDNILTLTSTDPSYLLSGVRCLALPVPVRQGVTSAITQCKTKDMLFALLIAKNQLITYLKPKEHSLHPIDIHMIFNLVDASTSFQATETWTPICLPKFNDTGFLHAYVCYLPGDSNACLLLISTNREKFFELKQCKERVIEKLERSGVLEQINTAIQKANYNINHLQAPQIRHFVYKSRKTSCITSPEVPSLYCEEEDRQRLFDHYMMMNQKLHSQTWPTKILYHVGADEAVLGWRTANFDLYIVFDPLISKPQAIMLGNKLIRWINKEEDKLIITSTYTF